MLSRFLLIRKGCPLCVEMLKSIKHINNKLPIKKKINVIDCWEYENFGLDNIPLMRKLHKDGLKYGFPFFYMDGIIIEPAPTPEVMKKLLNKYLEGEFEV